MTDHLLGTNDNIGGNYPQFHSFQVEEIATGRLKYLTGVRKIG